MARPASSSPLSGRPSKRAALRTESPDLLLYRSGTGDNPSLCYSEDDLQSRQIRCFSLHSIIYFGTGISHGLVAFPKSHRTSSLPLLVMYPKLALTRNRSDSMKCLWERNAKLWSDSLHPAWKKYICPLPCTSSNSRVPVRSCRRHFSRLHEFKSHVCAYHKSTDFSQTKKFSACEDCGMTFLRTHTCKQSPGSTTAVKHTVTDADTSQTQRESVK